MRAILFAPGVRPGGKYLSSVRVEAGVAGGTFSYRRIFTRAGAYPFCEAMKWLREIVRTCLAGVTLHLTLVAACTSGAGGGSKVVGKSESSGHVEPRAAVAREPLTIAEARADSGQRLKVLYYVAADGARQFATFHDTELEQDCAFATASDGVVRCLPRFASSSPFFLDKACSERVIWDSVCAVPEGAPVAYSLPVPANDCGGNPSVRYETQYYVAGAAVKPTVLFQSGPAGCTESTIFEAGVYRRLSPEVPAARFVAARLQE